MGQLLDNSIDLIIADPPFGDVVVKNEWNTILDPKEYLDFSKKWMKESTRIMKDTASMYVFSGMDYAAEFKIILTAPKYCNLQLLNWIIWKFDLGYHPTKRYKIRTNHIFFVSKSNNYTFNAENIRVLSNSKDKRNNPNGQIPCDMWEFSEPRKNSKEYVGHKAQKPLTLIERIIIASSNEGDIVFDPFLGSGTTAVACKNLNRNFVGCDINQEYVDLAKKRLSKNGIF